MQVTAVRGVIIALACTVPLALSGCGALNLDGATPTPGAATTAAADGDSWLVVVPGSATPSTTATRGAVRPSVTPTTPLPSGSPGCEDTRPVGQVLIPVAVTAGSGSLTVTWPTYGSGSSYRIAAVPQKLRTGTQPPLGWISVGAGRGCTATGTITGLTGGAPYVVWLDAPGTGQLVDGTRNPYSGRSRVVYPT